MSGQDELGCLHFIHTMSETSIPTEQQQQQLGFHAVLGPAVLEIDQAILSVQKSQANLGKEIERLVAGRKVFFLVV